MTDTKTSWVEMREGAIISVVLVLFDLVGYSAVHASAQKRSAPEAYRRRKQLSLDIQRRLQNKRYGARLHHWAGDGGLFAFPASYGDEIDRAYEAMVDVYDVFDAWKLRAPKHEGESLACRISGTLISELYADPEPGYWSHSELNEFLKYEREIGYPNAICVTEALRRHLKRYGANFPEERKRKVSLGPRTITVYEDKDHPMRADRSSASFGEWLRHTASDAYLSLAESSVRVDLKSLPADATQVGDSLVLSSAFSPDGYDIGNIELDEQRDAADVYDSDRFLNEVAEHDRTAWNAERNRLRNEKMSGTKFSVKKIMPMLTDDPVFRVRWSRCEYWDVAALYNISMLDPGVPRRNMDRALEVIKHGTKVPNTLSNHVLVVFGQSPSRQFLICHRNKSNEGRLGWYSHNRWSVSFEEQYAPVKERRISSADASIRDSVERGVREELIGGYDGVVRVSIHAFQLETLILNFGFLAVVELPDVESFEEIERLWKSALDVGEHDVIAALPLRQDILTACLASRDLPANIRNGSELSCSGSPGLGALQKGDHLWHPTSKVRLALALWLTQQPGSAR